MRRRLLAALSLGVLAAAMACASPTLPLPPPSLPTLHQGTDADHIALSGDCGSVEGSALVLVVNTNPSLRSDQTVSGTFANTCGAWDVPAVYAHKGDVLNITQQIGDLVSPPEVIEVQYVMP